MNPGALLDGLEVVGFGGRVERDRTPAVRRPILRDVKSGRLVVDLSQSGDGWRTELGESFRDGDEIPGVATRFGPVPARSQDLVMIVDDRLLDPSHTQAESAEAGSVVERLLEWVASAEARSTELRCDRVEGKVIWCCGPGEWAELRSLLGATAERDVLDAASAANLGRLLAASWRLSRSARNARDLALAAAGMKEAGTEHWHLLVEHGLRGLSAEDREGLLDAARRRIAVYQLKVCP